MTKAAIMKKQTVENLPYSLALQIREILDAAKKEHGKDVGDADDWRELEGKVIELVSEED